MEQLDFTEFFQTKAGASDFNTRLSFISEDIFKSNFDLEKSLMEQFGIQKKDKFLTLLRDNDISTESHTAIKDFICKIQEKISTLPVFSIKLAFEPKEQTLKALSEWFVMNIKKQVLLDIEVDQNLIAGAAISFNGEYINLSVKPRFDKILNDVLTSTPTPPVPLPEKVHQNIDSLSLGR